MSSREIGKITSVGTHEIIADVDADLGNYINTTDGIMFVGEVGSYVSIYEIGRTVIAEIIGVEEKTQLSSNEELIKPNSKRQVYLNLIGEIIENQFCFGVSKMPLIFSAIHMISEKELVTMLEVGKEEVIVKESTNDTRAILLTIGKSVVFPDYDVKVNIDRFFGFHFAIFGNTGAGKSNTLAKMLQEIFKKENYSAKGAKFAIIDSNGEYAKAFSRLNDVNSRVKHTELTVDENSVNKFEIPVWALSTDDWAILLHASEKTQVPVLKRAIDIARVFNNSNMTNDELKNHIISSTLIGIIQSSDTSPSKADKMKAIITRFGTQEINMDVEIKNGVKLRQAVTVNFGTLDNQEDVLKYLSTFVKPDAIIDSSKEIIPYDLDDFSQAVEFATLYEGSISSQRIQEYTATLVTRLQTIQEGIQGRILTKTAYTNIEEYIDSLLGENQIVTLDISTLDDSSAEVVTKVLAKLLLDYLKKKKIKADTPINFIIEEAHRFVENETNYAMSLT